MNAKDFIYFFLIHMYKALKQLKYFYKTLILK